jgi:hypothetical protein
MAPLQKQSQQTDSMNGKNEKDRNFNSGATFGFLIETRTLGNERTLIIHFNNFS